MIKALMLSWLVNKSMCVRTPPWMLRCSAAACGAPLQTTWTRWWSTACCLSSTSETGWPSPRQGPTPWDSPSAPPLTHQRPLCTTSSPPGTGKGHRPLTVFTFGVRNWAYLLCRCCLRLMFISLPQVWDAGHWSHPWGYTEELLFGPLFPQFLPHRGRSVCPRVAIIRLGSLYFPAFCC